MKQNEIFDKLTNAISSKLLEFFNSSVISFSAKGINIDLDSASEYIEKKIKEVDDVPDEEYSYEESLKLSAYYFLEAMIDKFEDDQYEEVLDLSGEEN